MKKHLPVCLIIGSALGLFLAATFREGEAGDPVQRMGRQRIPAGRVAFYFTARTFFDSNGFGIMGYLPFIENVPGPFFSDEGPASEATAFFTIRLLSFSFAGAKSVSPSPGVGMTTVPPGATFAIYYDPEPNQTFDDPDTFSDGQLIAVFRESALLLVDRPVGDDFGIGHNIFSSDLVASHPFVIDGRRYDFKRLTPGGVTIHNLTVGGDDDGVAAWAVSIGGTDDEGDEHAW